MLLFSRRMRGLAQDPVGKWIVNTFRASTSPVQIVFPRRDRHSDFLAITRLDTGPVLLLCFPGDVKPRHKEQNSHSGEKTNLRLSEKTSSLPRVLSCCRRSSKLASLLGVGPWKTPQFMTDQEHQVCLVPVCSCPGKRSSEWVDRWGQVSPSLAILQDPRQRPVSLYIWLYMWSLLGGPWWIRICYWSLLWFPFIVIKSNLCVF